MSWGRTNCVQAMVESVVLMRCREWSDDYRCWKCGLEFTLAADSDKHLLPNKGHTCAAVDRRTNHFAS